MAAAITFRLVLFWLGFLSLFCGHLSQLLRDKCKGKLDKCYCTDHVIDCVGHDFVYLDEIYPYITSKTQRISIINGKIKYLPSNLFGNVEYRAGSGKLLNVTYLRLSGNGIQGIGPGAFDRVPNLDTLDLSNNQVQLEQCDRPRSVARSLKDMKALKVLNLHGTFVKDNMMKCDIGFIVQGLNLTKLESLNLGNNGFHVAGKEFNEFISKAYTLRSLNLSHNEFSDVVYGLGYGSIVEYDISYNQIAILTALETDEIANMPMLKNIKLGGNPFHCDCRMNDALEWLNVTKQPLDFDEIVCKFSDNENVIGKPIKSLTVDDICEEPRIVICPGPYGPISVAKSSAWVIFVAAAVLIVVSVVSIVMYIRYRRRDTTGGQSSTTSHTEKSPAYSRMV